MRTPEEAAPIASRTRRINGSTAEEARAGIRRSPALWLFFVFVFSWTWAFWLAAALFGISAQSTGGITLEVGGLLGPMLGGIGFMYFTQSKEIWSEYWWRAIDFRRIELTWYLIILLFVPALFAVAVLLDIASSGNAALVLMSERVAPFLSAPSTIVPFLLGAFIYGPLPEELGWRGYALEQLQSRWNALISSLVLGAIWALWHLPLFFIRDTLFYGHGPWSPWFWEFMVQIIPLAIAFTWIFNNTRRSTLAAIIFHFIANVTADFANVTAGTNFYSTLLWIMAAVGLLILWDAGTLTRTFVVSQPPLRHR